MYARHVRRGVIAALLCALPMTAGAQSSPRPFGISVAAGPSIPMSDLADVANTGFHALGSLWIEPVARSFAFRGDVQWQQFADKHEGSFREVGGLANLIVSLPVTAARPYVIGGVGMMNFKAPDEEHGDHSHEGESRSNVAFGLGGGLRFGFGRVTAFGEVRYLNTGEGAASVPVTFGIKF